MQNEFQLNLTILGIPTVVTPEVLKGAKHSGYGFI